MNVVTGLCTPEKKKYCMNRTVVKECVFYKKEFTSLMYITYLKDIRLSK